MHDMYLYNRSLSTLLSLFLSRICVVSDVKTDESCFRRDCGGHVLLKVSKMKVVLVYMLGFSPA